VLYTPFWKESSINRNWNEHSGKPFKKNDFRNFCIVLKVGGQATANGTLPKLIGLTNFFTRTENYISKQFLRKSNLLDVKV